MDLAEIQKQYVSFGNSIYMEGYVDEQFTQLQELNDESHPTFLKEVVEIYLSDFAKNLQIVMNAFEDPVIDFEEITELLHTIKGSSSSVGAKKMKHLCEAFRAYSAEKNLQECLKYLLRVKEEYTIMKSKLESLLEMQEQIIAAGGVVPNLK